MVQIHLHEGERLGERGNRVLTSVSCIAVLSICGPIRIMSWYICIKKHMQDFIVLNFQLSSLYSHFMGVSRSKDKVLLLFGSFKGDRKCCFPILNVSHQSISLAGLNLELM